LRLREKDSENTEAAEKKRSARIDNITIIKEAAE